MNHPDPAREEYNRYQREWRARNKDKVRAIKKRYWARRAQKRREDAENEQANAD